MFPEFFEEIGLNNDKKIKMIKLKMMIITALALMISCSTAKEEIVSIDTSENIEYSQLPVRVGDRPATTDGIPHVQLDLDLVSEVHEEMIRRVFSVKGLANEPSVILSWKGLWIDSSVEIAKPEALISGREFGHIHDDGSLHIFLEPRRAEQAIEAGWAISHPYAVDGRDGWEGFVMLYTPQTIEELNVVFQLIVEAFNYVTGQEVQATDFY